MNERLSIRALGSLRITLDGRPVEGLDSRKAAALLVYLAMTGRIYPREVLAEMLWEERSQAQSMGNLRVVLCGLRHVLDDYVIITRQTVAMDSAANWSIDVGEFERLLQSGNMQLIQQAAVMYRDEFLSGFCVGSCAYESWAQLQRDRLRLMLMNGLDTLIVHRIHQENYFAGISLAYRLLQMDRLRERTHLQLMVLQFQAGHREAAMAQYKTCCQLLADELDLQPTPQMQAVYDRIRAGQPLDISPIVSELTG